MWAGIDLPGQNLPVDPTMRTRAQVHRTKPAGTIATVVNETRSSTLHGTREATVQTLEMTEAPAGTWRIAEISPCAALRAKRPVEPTSKILPTAV